MPLFRMLRLASMAGLGAMTMVACSTTATKPIPPVDRVDLPRFMGDWYVIAHVPSFIERNAYDAVETYRLDAEGLIQTTFRYRNGGFDEPVKAMHPTGTVRPDTGNAVWGMQFIWPIKAEYVVVHLNDDYSQTIVGRSARDYAWIMARSPTIPAADLDAHLRRLGELGYDLKDVRKVPQSGRPLPAE